jgi:hypothetical protein
MVLGVEGTKSAMRNMCVCVCVCVRCGTNSDTCCYLLLVQDRKISPHTERFPVLQTATTQCGIYWRHTLQFVGQDGAVGIATCYELGGPRVEFWWGQDFL